MQIFLTVISGVVIYVVGQSILQFVLEPIKEFNKQRGDTSFLLLSYRATMMQIPFYNLFAKFDVLPAKNDVFKAAQEINGISYGMGPIGKDEDSAQRNYKALQEIADALKVKTSFGA